MAIKELTSLWQASLEDKDFYFELKAQEIAVELAAQVAEAGLTQKQLADRLGWKTSRVSKVLHGATNLTLKTLFEVCEALNMEFSVTLSAKQEQQAQVVLEEEQYDFSTIASLLPKRRKMPFPELCPKPLAEFAS